MGKVKQGEEKKKQVILKITKTSEIIAPTVLLPIAVASWLRPARATDFTRHLINGLIVAIILFIFGVVILLIFN